MIGIKKYLYSVLLFSLIVFMSSCGTARRMKAEKENDKKETAVSTVTPPELQDTELTQHVTARDLLKFSKKELSSLTLIEEGVASWYGSVFHGRLTANGESFDMYSLTAAHRTLPFNTLVLVKNENNGKLVIVRINDRGPFAKNRIIDLSKEAADHLGMINSGTANVKLYVLEDVLAESSIENIKVATYTIQLASYENKSQAFEHAGSVTGSRVEIAYVNGEKVFRVYYGLYIDKYRAYEIQEKLARINIDGYVKQVENG